MKLFKYEKDKEFHRLTIFGIKFKKRHTNQKSAVTKQNRSIIKTEFNVLASLQSLQNLHSKAFPQFKNINDGRDVVIVATGPTLAKYEPIEGAVHIGLNRAYQFDKVKLDYIFMTDGTAVKNYIDEIDKLDDVIKFYGLNLFHEEYRPGVRIPEYHLKSKNSYRFYSYNYKEGIINPNLESFPLYHSGSISFPAIHFALWTHPKRIYLVGCDCSDAPYWDGGKREEDYLVKADRVNNLVIEGYSVLKEFAQRCYPDVEIISINPVGLKGLFTDMYQGGDE